jgi:hypothetical protein
MSSAQLFGPEATQFLNDLQETNPATASVYRPGLRRFEEYLAAPNEHKDFPSICGSHDFLNAITEDRKQDQDHKMAPDRKLIKGFIAWLKNKTPDGLIIAPDRKQYSPKTIRVYTGAVQTLCKIRDSPISTKWTGLPPAVEL